MPIVQGLVPTLAPRADAAALVSRINSLVQDRNGAYPSPQIKAAGTIDVGWEMSSTNDTLDPMSDLQAMFSSGLYEGKVLAFKPWRRYVFQTRPTTGFGPNDEYFTLPQKCTLEWAAGALLDFSGYSNTSSRTYFRREGSLGTAVAISNEIVAGQTRTFNVPSGQGTQFTRGSRCLLGASASWLNTDGGYTQCDAVSAASSVTASCSGTTLTVTLDSGFYVKPGAQFEGSGVTAGSYVVSGPAGGAGTYVISPSQTFGSTALRVSNGFNRKAESVRVASSTSSTVTVAAAPEFNYPTEAAPTLQLYLNQPEIHLINPCLQGPGRTASFASTDRAFLIAAGKRFTSDGGQIDDFGFSAFRVLSCEGGHIRGLQANVPDVAGAGLLYVADDTTDFVIEDVTSWGGSQPFGLAGSNYLPGISKRVTFRRVTGNGAINPFSTHNLCEQVEFLDCVANDVRGGAGFDLRSRYSRVRGGAVKNSTSTAVIMRFAINGAMIEGLRVENALGGVTLDQDDSQAWDEVPGNIAVRDCYFVNIGGVGSPGAVNLSYGLTDDVLGRAWIERNFASMNNNSHVYRMHGKWTSPITDNNRAEGYGSTSPTGRLVFYGAPTGLESAGNGPSNPMARNNSRSSTITDVLVQYETGTKTVAENQVDT